MRRHGTFAIAVFVSLGILVPGGGWTQETTVVVPNSNETADGHADNCLPWFCFPAVRYQQVYLGSEVGDGLITDINFRQDVVLGSAFTAVLDNVTIVLSSTTADPDGLSTTFSANVGFGETVVFSGSLMLSSATSTAVPRPFDVSVALATPFPFDSSTGLNLLIDITVPQTGVGSHLDYVSPPGDSTSRVFCQNDPECLTTDTATFADSGGLVTQFVFDASEIFFDDFESGDTSAWPAP